MALVHTKNQFVLYTYSCTCTDLHHRCLLCNLRWNGSAPRHRRATSTHNTRIRWRLSTVQQQAQKTNSLPTPFLSRARPVHSTSLSNIHAHAHTHSFIYSTGHPPPPMPTSLSTQEWACYILMEKWRPWLNILSLKNGTDTFNASVCAWKSASGRAAESGKSLCVTCCRAYYTNAELKVRTVSGVELRHGEGTRWYSQTKPSPGLVLTSVINSLTVNRQHDTHNTLHISSFSFWVVHIHVYTHTYVLMYKNIGFSFLNSIVTAELVLSKIKQEIKWIPEDTEYKNTIILCGLSNRVAQKALGSCLKVSSRKFETIWVQFCHLKRRREKSEVKNGSSYSYLCFFSFFKSTYQITKNKYKEDISVTLVFCRGKDGK